MDASSLPLRAGVTSIEFAGVPSSLIASSISQQGFTPFFAAAASTCETMSAVGTFSLNSTSEPPFAAHSSMRLRVVGSILLTPANVRTS